jgi:hypothetical protein
MEDGVWDAGHWSLVTGYSLLVTRYSSLVTRHSLLVTRYLMLDAIAGVRLTAHGVRGWDLVARCGIHRQVHGSRRREHRGKGRLQMTED